MSHEHKNCHELLGQLSDYVDGSLEQQLCTELEKHLSGCENCRVVVDTLKMTISLYQTTGMEETLPGAARERLFHSLNLDDLLKPRDADV